MSMMFNRAVTVCCTIKYCLHFCFTVRLFGILYCGQADVRPFTIVYLRS